MPPGKCIDLEIESTPTTKTGNVDYFIPIRGNVAMWFKDRVEVPPNSGLHWNWDIPVQKLLTIAEVLPCPLIMMQ